MTDENGVRVHRCRGVRDRYVRVVRGIGAMTLTEALETYRATLQYYADHSIEPWAARVALDKVGAEYSADEEDELDAELYKALAKAQEMANLLFQVVKHAASYISPNMRNDFINKLHKLQKDHDRDG